VFVVDTNILLYAADRSAAEHEQCRELLEHWRSNADAWYLTWKIVYEFLRVATHPRVFRKPWTVQQAWSFIDVLKSSPSVGVLTETDRHAAVAAQVWTELPDLRGNIVHDAHTAIVMRENGIRDIYTRDMHFHRFAFLRVLDPVTTT
jgi:toxin-antitoxin system PIN domain toxin